MKNYKNYISFGGLLLILCVIILAFSKISQSNNLNANQGKNINQNNSGLPFEYISSRPSLNENVNFENNFGGSNSDNINYSYRLNNFYLIGTTDSKDKYFENCKGNDIFIMLTDYSGNVLNLYNHSFSSQPEFIESKILNNCIYILVNAKGAHLLEFNLSTNTIKSVYSSNAIAIDLIASHEIIIMQKLNNKTEFVFYESNASVSYNYVIPKLHLSAPYNNGTLIFFNYMNNINICILDKNGVHEIKTFNNSHLLNFNITANNVILLVKEQDSKYILILLTSQ